MALIFLSHTLNILVLKINKAQYCYQFYNYLKLVLMLLFFFKSTATMIELSISTEFQSINFEHSLILISFNTPCSVNKLIRTKFSNCR